jgi:hypothetical protein
MVHVKWGHTQATLLLGGSNTLRMEPTSRTIATDHEFAFPGFLQVQLCFSDRLLSR